MMEKRKEREKMERGDVHVPELHMLADNGKVRRGL